MEERLNQGWRSYYKIDVWVNIQGIGQQGRKKVNQIAGI